jgi:hypothetical protein
MGDYENDPIYKFGQASGQMLGAMAALSEPIDKEMRALALAKMADALQQIINLVDSYAQDEGQQLNLKEKHE